MPRPRYVTYYEALFCDYEPIARNHSRLSAVLPRASSVSVRLLLAYPTAKLNAFLVVAMIAAFAAYVYFANTVAALHFSNAELGKQVAAVNERNGALEAQYSENRDTLDLIQFAQRHNMVPASGAVHLFESKGVALRR
ncbi:MAG: hypothetical protein AAB864_00215 [Patescibacteria group bacterium]